MVPVQRHRMWMTDLPMDSRQDGGTECAAFGNKRVSFPIYRLLGQGLNDGDIARKLNLTEVNVQSCIAWILHFLNLENREELAAYAASAA